MDANVAVDQSLATVAVIGEVDLSTTPGLHSAIARALATPGVDAIVIDLSECSFLDSSGISELLKGRRTCDDTGVAYTVRGAQGIVLRVLEMSGVWAHLTGDSASSVDQS